MSNEFPPECDSYQGKDAFQTACYNYTNNNNLIKKQNISAVYYVESDPNDRLESVQVENFSNKKP